MFSDKKIIYTSMHFIERNFPCKNAGYMNSESCIFHIFLFFTMIDKSNPFRFEYEEAAILPLMSILHKLKYITSKFKSHIIVNQHLVSTDGLFKLA